MNILIAGIGRNIANSIPFLKTTFEGIASQVAECAVVIYENNSTDHSSELLQAWSAQDLRVRARSEYISPEEQLNQGKARTWDNQPCRLEILAAARNKLLAMILEPQYEGYELVLILDLDIPQPLPQKETLDAIRSFPDDAAAVFSFGVNSVGKMYDLHPYRDNAFPFGPEIVGDEFFSIPNQKRLFKHTNKLKTCQFHPVFSAFNGAALYRRALLQGCVYSAHPTKALDEYYRDQAERLGKSPADWFPGNTHIASTLQGVYLFGTDGFFYRNNVGYNFPVVIGHSTLHASLIKKGKLYLRPAWIHYSGHPGYNFWDEIIQTKFQQLASRILRRNRLLKK